MNIYLLIILNHINRHLCIRQMDGAGTSELWLIQGSLICTGPVPRCYIKRYELLHHVQACYKELKGI